MSNSTQGQVKNPEQLNYEGDPNATTTHMTWTEEITITPVRRTDSSVKEQRQEALSTAKERAKNDLKKILAKHGHDLKSARKNEKLWKKVNAAYKKRTRKYFQEIVSSRQNNRSNVKNQISQVNPSWDSMREVNLEHIHTALDIAGLIPGFGIVPDAMNAGLYIIKGDWVNAGISAAAMVPIFGQGATVTKHGISVTKELIEREGKEGIAKALNKAKKKGVSEKQLTEVGKRKPVALTNHELNRVNQWTDTRNRYQKKWRNIPLNDYQEKTQQLLKTSNQAKSTELAISKHMTPDDYAGVVKENKGIEIPNEKTGGIHNHKQEAEDAVRSIDNHVESIQKHLNHMEKYGKVDTKDYKILQDKVHDLSVLRSQYIIPKYE